MLKGNKDIALENVPLGLFLLMRFNQMQLPFNNPAIRRAVMMAINQTDYMEAVSATRITTRRPDLLHAGRADVDGGRRY